MVGRWRCTSWEDGEWSIPSGLGVSASSRPNIKAIARAKSAFMNNWLMLGMGGAGGGGGCRGCWRVEGVGRGWCYIGMLCV